MKVKVSLILLAMLMSGVMAEEATADTAMGELTPEKIDQEISDPRMKKRVMNYPAAERAGYLVRSPCLFKI